MKKLIAILLTFVLFVGVFSACSKTENNDSTSNQSINRIVVDSHYSDTNESVMYAYQKLCDAVIAGDEVATFNTQLLNDVFQLFYTSFPLNALVDEVKVLDDKSGVSLTYKNDLNTHLELVTQFNSRVDEILSTCNMGSASADEFIVNVYSYVANNFTVSNDYVSSFDTLINSAGVEASINQVFEYLLLCGNCEASHIVETTGAVSILSYVKFDSSYYYFDVASEIKNNEGKALHYFAMDNERLGTYAPGQHYFTDQAVVPAVEDSTYSKLAQSISYELGDKTISVNCGEEAPYVIEIK